MLLNNGRQFMLSRFNHSDKNYANLIVLNGERLTASLNATYFGISTAATGIVSNCFTDNFSFSSSTTTNSWLTPYDGYSMFFGTGTTPVDLDDYNLENRITEEDNLLVFRNGALVTQGLFVSEIIVQVEALNEVTVTEIGTVCSVQYSSTDFRNPLLITRTVLDEPVHLHKGDSYVFIDAIQLDIE